MKSSIKIPDKIKVGFQERSGTYTKKLAYVIYYDEKGTLRKETSWQSWRDKNIPSEDFENVPTEGFVLNKKAGGYSTGWNHRQTYCRVYDPRGFEFEITIPNLLYILENTNSIKGKGLEGEFIYGWDGKDLLIIPVDSPDYSEIQKFNSIIKNKEYIKAKDLKIGATYLNKENKKLIYMGKFDCYDLRGMKKAKKEFFFADENMYSGFTSMGSLGQKLISCESEECVENYAELMDKLEHKRDYSPLDRGRKEYIEYTWEEFYEKYRANKGYYYTNSFYDAEEDDRTLNYPSNSAYDSEKVDENIQYYVDYQTKGWTRPETTFLFKGTLKEIFEKFKPQYRNVYLQNGKLYATMVTPQTRI